MSVSSFVAAIIPLLSGILGALASSLPISLTGGAVPPPLLSFMAVYFWCLVRPDLMPPAAALLIGIVQDFVSGSPIGLWATAYVAIYAVLEGQRESFAGLAGIGAILGFALAMLLVTAAAYGIAAVYFWRVLPLMPHVLQIAVSVLCYIPLLPMLNGLQHKVVGPLRSEF